MMNSTMLKIIDLCEKVISDNSIYNTDVHMAKNISCKIDRRFKLTRMDLDLITQLQIKYGM